MCIRDLDYGSCKHVSGCVFPFQVSVAGATVFWLYTWPGHSFHSFHLCFNRCYASLFVILKLIKAVTMNMKQLNFSIPLEPCSQP